MAEQRRESRGVVGCRIEYPVFALSQALRANALWVSHGDKPTVDPSFPYVAKSVPPQLGKGGRNEKEDERQSFDFA